MSWLIIAFAVLLSALGILRGKKKGDAATREIQQLVDVSRDELEDMDAGEGERWKEAYRNWSRDRVDG